MSIDMNKIDSLYEKLDVISNLIEQMNLAFLTKDKQKFIEVYNKASKLCFDAGIQLEKEFDE